MIITRRDALIAGPTEQQKEGKLDEYWDFYNLIKSLYPASWVDWPVLGRLTAGTFFAMPGMPGKLPRTAFLQVAHLGQVLLVPLARLVTAVGLIIGCLAGARYRHVPPRPWRLERFDQGSEHGLPVERAEERVQSHRY